MQNHNLNDAPAEEKRAAVAALLEKNPDITSPEIEELTGLAHSTVYYILNKLKGTSQLFSTENELETWIKDNTHLVFGEKIR